MGARAISLRAWSAADRELLDRTVGDRAMMRHLGGPETADACDARHRRYVALARAGPACMYAIELDRSDGGDGARESVGSIGFWETTWRDEPIYETGWMVCTAFAGRGIATTAARLAIDLARSVVTNAPLDVRHALHAFPARENATSNALCAKLGFERRGDCDVEYPRGHTMRAVDWRLALRDR